MNVCVVSTLNRAVSQMLHTSQTLKCISLCLKVPSNGLCVNLLRMREKSLWALKS